MRAAFLGGCALAVPAAAFIYTSPTYSAYPSLHDPCGTTDSAVLRHVGPQSAPVDPAENPGVRAFPNFINGAEARELLQELQPIKQRYGLNLIGAREAAVYKWQQSLLGRRQPPVNMMRITGRPESEQQRLAPWGYGDDCDESKLPPRLAALVARVRALPGLRLGQLRDVTINYRHSGFLRLDPHVDPAADGENVFIIGVDSDTVLTLCPAARRDLWRWLCTVWDAVRLRDERERVVQEAFESWTPWDIDVLARARTLVHLSGDARWSWTHGTRVGIPIDPKDAPVTQATPPDKPPVEGAGAMLRQTSQTHKDAASGASGSVPASLYGLHDFWGTPAHVVVRGTERHSVVLAFAAG